MKFIVQSTLGLGAWLACLTAACVVGSIFTGCSSKESANVPNFGPQDIPTRGRDYDPEFVDKRSKKLGLRPVDYLHWVNSGKANQ